MVTFYSVRFELICARAFRFARRRKLEQESNPRPLCLLWWHGNGERSLRIEIIFVLSRKSCMLWVYDHGNIFRGILDTDCTKFKKNDNFLHWNSHQICWPYISTYYDSLSTSWVFGKKYITTIFLSKFRTYRQSYMVKSTWNCNY